MPFTKGNVFWELSGWAPKYFPTQLKVDIRGRLKEKILFGSDYPSFPYSRLFREWNELGYSDDIKERVFHSNAERVLGLAGSADRQVRPPPAGPNQQAQ